MDFLHILRGIGFAMILGGVVLFRLHRRRRTEWTATSGRVIEMNRANSTHRRSRALRPVVEFHAANKHRIRFEGTVASWPPRYKAGDRAKVLYDPKNPNEAILDDSDSSWIAPAILAGMGLIIALLSFVEKQSR